MTRLADRILFVTGAASGIGRATAIRLAEDGASLFLTDLAADARALKAECSADEDAEAMVLGISDAFMSAAHCLLLPPVPYRLSGVLSRS